MTIEELKELRTLDTKLKAKFIEDDENSFTFSMKDNWVVTDIGLNISGETAYVTQPLEIISGQEGFTGMWVYVLKEEEILHYFDLK